MLAAHGSSRCSSSVSAGVRRPNDAAAGRIEPIVLPRGSRYAHPGLRLGAGSRRSTDRDLPRGASLHRRGLHEAVLADAARSAPDVPARACSAYAARSARGIPVQGCFAGAACSVRDARGGRLALHSRRALYVTFLRRLALHSRRLLRSNLRRALCVALDVTFRRGLASGSAARSRMTFGRGRPLVFATDPAFARGAACSVRIPIGIRRCNVRRLGLCAMLTAGIRRRDVRRLGLCAMLTAGIRRRDVWRLGLCAMLTAGIRRRRREVRSVSARSARSLCEDAT